MGCHRRLCLRLLWPSPLTFWPENLTQAQVHMWPYCGEISPRVTKILYSHGVLGHCLLWPWPFDPEILSARLWTQLLLWPKLGWNSLNCFWHIVFTRFSLFGVILTFWPQNLISTSLNQIHGWVVNLFFGGIILVQFLWWWLENVASHTSGYEWLGKNDLTGGLVANMTVSGSVRWIFYTVECVLCSCLYRPALIFTVMCLCALCQ